MIRFPCPYCGAILRPKDGPSRGNKRRCPHCNQYVYLLPEDDDEFRETYPYMQWTPCPAGEASKEHIELARCGINGSNVFHRDDPVVAGWWAARRKGLHPCGCMFTPISQEDAAEMNLRPVFVRALRFDPWSANNTCVLK